MQRFRSNAKGDSMRKIIATVNDPCDIESITFIIDDQSEVEGVMGDLGYGSSDYNLSFKTEEPLPDPNAHYMFFDDFCEREQKLILITDEEYEKLLPYKDDMYNCNPIPDELQEIIFNDIYLRVCVNDKVTPKDENCLIQRIC
jgi:hypothetical protein